MRWSILQHRNNHFRIISNSLCHDLIDTLSTPSGRKPITRTVISSPALVHIIVLKDARTIYILRVIIVVPTSALVSLFQLSLYSTPFVTTNHFFIKCVSIPIVAHVRSFLSLINVTYKRLFSLAITLSSEVHPMKLPYLYLLNQYLQMRLSLF